MTTSHNPRPGNALRSVAGLLEALGVEGVSTLDAAEAAVSAHAHDLGLEAHLESLSHGCAVVTATSSDAYLLRLNADSLLEAINAVTDRPVDRVSVRARPRVARRRVTS